MKYTQEQLEARFGEASERVQQVITSLEVAEQINTLREKYGLHIDDAGTLMDEVGYVLLGLTHPDAFVDSLKKSLDIPRSVVEKIATEINEIVFKPIHTELVRPENTSSTPETTDADRESILKEIETEDIPVQPASMPATPETKQPAPTPTPVQEKPQVAPTSQHNTSGVPPTQLPTQPSVDLAKTKLSQGVSLPREKESQVSTSEKAHTTPPIQKKPYGGQDPYREPVSESDLKIN